MHLDLSTILKQVSNACNPDGKTIEENPNKKYMWKSTLNSFQWISDISLCQNMEAVYFWHLSHFWPFPADIMVF